MSFTVEEHIRTLEPSTRRALGDAERPDSVPLLPALLLELPGTKPPLASIPGLVQ